MQWQDSMASLEPDVSKPGRRQRWSPRLNRSGRWMLSESASAKTLESLGVLQCVTLTGMDSDSDSRDLVPAESASRPTQS